MIEIVRTVDDLRGWVTNCRAKGQSVGLVPTMGALHAGHMALAARSLDVTERSVASLFVNPRQFGEGEDLESYPRNEDDDGAKLEAAGVHLLFAPSVDEMYPQGFTTGVRVGALGDILEGAYRPGFFDGVATVVSKLLNQAGANRAFFGEKDYQQLLVVRTMARDLDIPTVIEGVETVREADGLALSSRNVYLSPDERRAAPILYKTISDVAAGAKDAASIAALENKAREQVLAAGFCDVDYLSVHDAGTLQPYQDRSRPGRVLVAAKLGRTRLIDNVPVL
jgi:pantoate--beta-alanine ligase